MVEKEKILRLEIKKLKKKQDESLKKMQLIENEAKKEKRAGRLQSPREIEKKMNRMTSPGEESWKLGSMGMDKLFELNKLRKIKKQNKAR